MILQKERVNQLYMSVNYFEKILKTPEFIQGTSIYQKVILGHYKAVKEDLEFNKLRGCK